EDHAVRHQGRRVEIACGIDAAGIAKCKRGVAGQSRHRRRSQKKRDRDRALLGGGSLPERERDQANGHKHKQVKGASKKMRFDVWISLFFHFDLISGSAFWLVCSADVLRNLRNEVFGIFRKSENLTWGTVVRSPIVSVPASAAYRGKAPIF